MRRVAILVLALCAPASIAAAGKTAPRNVAIVIYEGAEILDLAGPSEVLYAAGSLAGEGQDSAFNVYTVSRSREPVLSQGFIRIAPQYSIADAPRPDIIVIPGGRSDELSNDPTMMTWLKSATGAASATLTV